MSILFLIHRNNQIYADGCIFQNGRVAVSCRDENKSITMWGDISEAHKMYCHDGNTEIEILETITKKELLEMINQLKDKQE